MPPSTYRYRLQRLHGWVHRWSEWGNPPVAPRRYGLSGEMHRTLIDPQLYICKYGPYCCGMVECGGGEVYSILALLALAETQSRRHCRSGIPRYGLEGSARSCSTVGSVRTTRAGVPTATE